MVSMCCGQKYHSNVSNFPSIPTKRFKSEALWTQMLGLHVFASIAWFSPLLQEALRTWFANYQSLIVLAMGM